MAVASTSAVLAARPTSTREPRPTARPTRTVAALARPSGIMNAMEASCSAMPCAASGAVPSHPIMIEDGGEQPHLGDDRGADRPAEPQDLGEGVPVRPPEARVELVPRQRRGASGVGQQQRRHQQVGDRRGHRRADDAERGRAEVPEDQRIVQHAVEDGPGRDDREQQVGPPHHREVGPDPGDRQRRQHRPLHHAHVVAGERRDLRSLAEREEDRLGMPERQHDEHAVERQHPQPHADRAAHARASPAPSAPAASGIIACEKPTPKM